MNPKYHVGQKMNTVQFGIITVVEVYKSTTRDDYIYVVQPSDTDYTMILQESDIEQEGDWHAQE